MTKTPKDGTPTEIIVTRGTGDRQVVTARIPGYWFAGVKVTVPVARRREITRSCYKHGGTDICKTCDCGRLTS